MQAHARYRQVQVQTTSPGELLLALYDALFRNLDGAIVCFERGQVAAGMELCSKAHAIVSELQIALDHQAAPELCARLSALYDFALDRVSSAQRHAKPALIHEAKKALGPIRDGFKLAVPKAAAEKAMARQQGAVQGHAPAR